MNSKEFSLIIENVVKEKRPITYIEAIVWYCDENNIETLWGIGGKNKSNSSSWILKKWKE